MTKPLVVCICGSTRFREEMVEANRRFTMAGMIVLAPGVFQHKGDPLTEADKVKLDELHFRKIDLADQVYVVNPGNYIGESTQREIEYALSIGKPVSQRECWHDDSECHCHWLGREPLPAGTPSPPHHLALTRRRPNPAPPKPLLQLTTT